MEIRTVCSDYPISALTNFKVRLRGTTSVTRPFNGVYGYSNIILQCVVFAVSIEGNKYCRMDYSVDNKNWFFSRLLLSGPDTTTDLAQAVYTSSVANSVSTLYVRLAIQGTSSSDSCYFRSLTIVGTPTGSQNEPTCSLDCPPVGNGPTTRTLLTYDILTGSAVPTSTVDNSAFLIPSNALNPTNFFSGTFQLPQGIPGINSFQYVYNDTYDYAYLFQTSILPFDVMYTVQQIGTHLVPCFPMNQRNIHKLYELVLSGGRVWNENSDHGFTRASFSFALSQRNANCVWNGMMMFLFKVIGGEIQMSNVFYQITQETCLYFQADMWGFLTPSLIQSTPNSCSASRISNFLNWRQNLMRTSPLKGPTGLSTALSGVDFTTMPTQKFEEKYISIIGVYYNGAFYNDMGAARAGATKNSPGNFNGSPYPLPEYLLLPSYSTAKTFLTFLMYLRFSQKHPSLNIFLQPIRNFVPACSNFGSDILVHHVLSMVDNRYTSTGYLVDEYSGITEEKFFLKYSAADKTKFACTHWPAQSGSPGNTWVYHTSDTYLATVALNTLIQKYEGGIDAKQFWYNEFVAPLVLSEISADIRVTYETWYKPQVWGGWGGFLYRDDIAKISALTNSNSGKINSTQWLDAVQLSMAMQRNPNNFGYIIQSLGNNTSDNPFQYNFKYKNTVWAIDLYRNNTVYNTCGILYNPFAVGYGGIRVSMLLNQMTYLFFSDGKLTDWYSAGLTLSQSVDVHTGIVQSPCNYKQLYTGS